MTRKTAFALGLSLLAATSSSVTATEPNGGYYEGLATLYPYEPVFCDKNSGLGGPCFGMPGAGMFLPRSAPLPPTDKHCRWADINDPKATVDTGHGWGIVTGEGWYQWEPRTITLYDAPAKVCYFEDRGNPQNINNLPKESLAAATYWVMMILFGTLKDGVTAPGWHYDEHNRLVLYNDKEQCLRKAAELVAIYGTEEAYAICVEGAAKP